MKIYECCIIAKIFENGSSEVLFEKSLKIIDDRYWNNKSKWIARYEEDFDIIKSHCLYSKMFRSII